MTGISAIDFLLGTSFYKVMSTSNGTDYLWKTLQYFIISCIIIKLVQKLSLPKKGTTK